MPILWRYLLTHFLKVTILSVFAFVTILLAMQLDEIAHFAALGAPLPYILLFALYQIPYILPIAIPISCLIASMILVQRLSSTHELTALRASGYALRDILAPILLSAAFLTIFNFWIVSEVATQSHLTTNQLKSKLRSINPLLLLNNKHLMRLRGLYFDALGPSRIGEFAQDVLLALPSTNEGRINLLLAKQLASTPSAFTGKNVSLLTTFDSEIAENYDHFLIENIEDLKTASDDFSHLLQNKVWTVNNDYLNLSLLLIRIRDQQTALQQQNPHLDSDQIKQLRSKLNHSLSDIMRRASIAFAVFSFTLMGASFGMNISRQRKKSSLYIAIVLTALFLAAFFVAKGSNHTLAISTLLYLGPHVILIASSLVVLKRVAKGIE